MFQHTPRRCSTPKSDVVGVAYLDMAFLYDVGTGGLQRAAAAGDRKKLYVGIPHALRPSLPDPVLAAAGQRLQEFYSQTFWCNEKGHRTAW